jgi:FkbH-like protein
MSAKPQAGNYMPVPSSSHRPKIAISATFTADPLLPALQFVLEEAGLELEVHFAPYHQVFQELLSSNSLLASNRDGLDVVLLRLEDFVRDVSGIEEARTIVARTVDELSDALRLHANRVKVPTIVAILPPSPNATAALLPILHAASNELSERARRLPGIALLSPEEVDLVSMGDRYDSLADEMAHMPFTDEHYASLALALARKVHALRVPPFKVFVLDCDETLWRGVVGEDGVDGITIPPAMVRLQRFACDVQARGILVCLVSKNAERDVIEVFQRRSEMVLKLEHIVAHRINWDSKPANIASLARALNLGLDAFAFLDDNPLECALVQSELPQVVTLRLPPDGEVESFLSHLWIFDKVNVTDEDIRRTSMYQENAAREELEKRTTDIAEFMASLKVVVDIADPLDSEWPRIAQLTQRTNQFNFTTLRRNESEMRSLVSSGKFVLRVKVSDRFGDYGLVGLVIAESRAELLLIDTFLLSCRVLGRGVEHAIMRRLGEIADNRKLMHLDLPYFPTPKNEPARAFVEDVAAGFRVGENDHVVYHVPVDYARSIAHRPGHDPAAVVEARNSGETKVSAASKVSAAANDRSQRYARLAGELVSGQTVLRAMRARDVRVRSLAGQATRPATATEHKLLALWQRLLGIDELGVEDDYFALGGTSVLAAKLFAKIAREFGVKLRLTTILDAPTVRSLSRYLEPEQRDRSDALIELKPGKSRNLFLVHDGDGETLLYLNLARRMPEDLAVLGLEPRRLPKVPLAHTGIKDMAAFYIEEMRQRQPSGPYLLGGMCAGGVIAYEIASQLVDAGERVELLALLDTATPQTPKRRGRMSKARGRRVAQVFSDAQSMQRSFVVRGLFVARTISRKIVNTLTWEITHRLSRLSVRFRFGLLRRLLERGWPWPSFLSELTVRQIYDSAELLYAPQPLPEASVVLVRATTGEADDTPYREIYRDDVLGWGSLTSALTVVDVEGGHSSMLQEPFVESLANALLPHLSGTAAQEPAIDRTRAGKLVVDTQPLDAA